MALPYKYQRGKKAKEWDRTKREWYKQNPPDYRGYWTCGVCGQPVDNPDLDHIKKKGSHPELRNNLDNLRPVHRSCHIRIT